MRRSLLGTYLALTLFVLLALEIPLGVITARNLRRDLVTRVERDAVTMASLSTETLERYPGTVLVVPLRKLASAYAKEAEARVLVVATDGVSVVDTASPPGRSFASRPEIKAALDGATVSGDRYSKTLGANFLYVAVPAASGGKVLGAVRITYPTAALDDRVQHAWLILAAAGAVVLALAAVLGLRFAAAVTNPLGAVRRAARRAGGGDLSVRVPEDQGPPEVRELGHSFNEMVVRLDALVSSQQAFVADASHELRTPLTALRLRLESLEREVGTGGQADLDAALAEVERLNALVSELLALARADAGAEAEEDVDLAQLVGDRVAAWEPVASEQGVRLVARAPGPLVARAGRGRVNQVLDNLLANALEASAAGTTILVEGVRDGAGAVLRVADEGRGMTEEERRRAFDRFWRGRSTAKGSGLGLAIVKRLVELDGGTVELLAREPNGTEVVVRLHGR